MEQKVEKRKKWIKRIGVAGFLFFLAKGLVWLTLLVIAWVKLKN